MNHGFLDPHILTCPCDTRWSLGSALFLASWAAMMGPLNYVQHLISTPRLPFTATYFGSIALTLYFSLGVCVTGDTTNKSSLLMAPFVAREHHSNSNISTHTAGLSYLVLGQLFPDGIQWVRNPFSRHLQLEPSTSAPLTVIPPSLLSTIADFQVDCDSQQASARNGLPHG